MPPTVAQLAKRMDKLERALAQLRHHIDPDAILTAEDYRALIAYREERSRDALTDGDQLRRELGL